MTPPPALVRLAQMTSPGLRIRVRGDALVIPVACEADIDQLNYHHSEILAHAEELGVKRLVFRVRVRR